MSRSEALEALVRAAEAHEFAVESYAREALPEAALEYARACGWFPPEAVAPARGRQVDADGRPRLLDRDYVRAVEGESIRRGARVAELEGALRSFVEELAPAVEALRPFDRHVTSILDRAVAALEGKR